LKPIIFLPIEVKNREFYSKLFFASRALRNNYDCFIGNKIAVNRAIKYFGNGIYFYKSMNFYDFKHIEYVKSKGNIYIVQDEEGSVLNKDEFKNFIKIRGSDKNLKLIDRFYTWGEFDNKIWQKLYKNHKDKFLLTGSPRIDIWKEKIANKIYSNDIQRIKKNFDKFTLILSSGISSKLELKKKIKIDRITRSPLGESEQKILQRNVWQLRINKDLFQLAEKLALKFPNKKFIFRPHPDENIDDYKSKNPKKISNLSIVSSYDVTPWIISSERIIQSCSTVAIQANFLKKQIISFDPIYLKNVHRNFPNKFGINFKTQESLIKFFNFKNIKRKNNNLLLNRFLASKKYCSDLILKDINKLKKKKKFKINYLKFLFLGFLFNLKDKIIDLNAKKDHRSFYEGRRSSKQKNPGIDKKEIIEFYKIIDKNNNFKVKTLLNNGHLIQNNKN